MKALSNALDRMVKVAACEGGSPEDHAAVAQLLQLAVERFGSFDAWALVSFIRCAAAFKGLLQPQQLAAWQVAVQGSGAVCHMKPQGVSNALLSLGTLAYADERLAQQVSKQLAWRLLERAVHLVRKRGQKAAASADSEQARHAASVLYGVALLLLRPSQEQVVALLDAVRPHLQRHATDQQGDAELSWHGGREQAAGFNVVSATQLVHALAKLIDAQTTAAPEPGANPFKMYYDAELLDDLLHVVVAQQPDGQCVSQIVGALGMLRHVPQPAIWQRLVSGAMSAACLWLHAWLVGCAWLGRNPGPKAIRACLEAVERDGGSRQLANVVWATAVLQACDLGTWSRLVARGEGAVLELPDVGLVQWATAYRHMQLQHGSSIPRPPELLQRSLAAQAAALKQMKWHPSQFERALAAAVQQLAAGQEVQPGYIATGCNGQPLALVDVALPQLRIAVEAVGPTHFLRNGGSRDAVQPQLNGPTQGRISLLQGAGWLVVSVPYAAAWDPMFEGSIRPSQEQLVAGLLQYLHDHTPLLAALRERSAVPASAA
ncbi:hypothetical protein ABPG75_008627 [Micractinium tetrahymenae]